MEWLTEPYSLEEDTEELAGVIGTGTMVSNATFHNRVGGAPCWRTRSRLKTVIEVRYVLQTGVEMDEINPKNPLSRKEATQQKAKKVCILDHKEIMEEAEKCDWLEYDDDNDKEKSDEDESGSEVGSDSW